VSIKTVFGVPAHPLLVHFPALGIPLVALAVAFYVLAPSRRETIFWPTVVGIILVTIATILAAQTGEQLDEMLPRSDRQSALLRHHTQLGDQTQAIMIIFAAVALGFLAIDWLRRNPDRFTESTLAPATAAVQSNRLTRAILALGILAVVLGGVATIWDVRTGHAGAKSAWNGVGSGGPAPGEANRSGR
jgi:uncharacterized membrane protein